MAATLSLKHFFCPFYSYPSHKHGSLVENFPRSYQVKKELNLEGRWLLSNKKFRLNCLGHRDMDKLDIEDPKPSISKLFSEFNPYDAMLTIRQHSKEVESPYGCENPMQDVLERFLARLEEADQAFCFCTEMAALYAVTRLVENGQEIVAGDDITAVSDRLLTVASKLGVVVKRVNISDLSEVAAVIGPKTKLVWLESPTNPGLQIADIPRIGEMAHAYGALVLVDNTIMSPVLLQPLKLGADIVLHSAITLIAGYHHTMGGVLAVKGDSLAKEMLLLRNKSRGGLSPFNCLYCLSGFKTMALRVEKQQDNAQKIAEFLAFHPLVKKVNYPGLAGHPGRDLHYSQAKGAGFVISFQTGSLALSKRIVETTKHFTRSKIFVGSMNSFISLPCFDDNRSIPKEVREARGLTEDLIRISIGIEDANELIAELDNALRIGACG
ncbi:hypothetical protein PTKIN_Ptkin07bG0059000 [Pterospermum kingtungense]